MQAFFRFTALILLLVVGFHTVETDGPCDYEEHYIAKTFNVDVHSHYQIPEHHDHDETDANFGEHFGHCSVVLDSAFSIFQFAPNKIGASYVFHRFQLSGYISENFRPPRLV